MPTLRFFSPKSSTGPVIKNSFKEGLLRDRCVHTIPVKLEDTGSSHQLDPSIHPYYEAPESDGCTQVSHKSCDVDDATLVLSEALLGEYNHNVRHVAKDIVCNVFIPGADASADVKTCDDLRDRFNKCSRELSIKGMHGIDSEHDYALIMAAYCSFFQEIENIKAMPIETLGCLQLVYLCLDYAVRKHPSITSEIFHSELSGNYFLVINRTEGLDSADPKDWGSNCYICDPKSNKSFLASDYSQYLLRHNKTNKSPVECYMKNFHDISFKPEHLEIIIKLIDADKDPKVEFSKSFVRAVCERRNKSDSILLNDLVQKLQAT